MSLGSQTRLWAGLGVAKRPSPTARSTTLAHAADSYGVTPDPPGLEG